MLGEGMKNEWMRGAAMVNDAAVLSEWLAWSVIAGNW